MVGKLTGFYQLQKSPDLPLKRVSHGDHRSIDHKKLLINGDLDDQDSVLAERKGFLLPDTAKSRKDDT